MLTIDDFLTTYTDSLAWGRALARVPAAQWLAPMREGGWSVAESLAHLTAWDGYALAERLPAIAPGADLQGGPDVESFNAQAAEHARTGASQADVIAEFITTREALIEHVRRFKPGAIGESFSIRGTPITMHEYLNELMTHHQHHALEIDTFLQRVSATS